MGASLIDFLTRERLIDAKQLQEKIDETVEALFGSLSLSVVQSVVNRFLQKYPFSDGETRFAQILREAELLLPLNLNASYYYNEPGKSFKIVGFKNTEEREIKQFRALLSRNLGISDTAIKPTQTESEVVIINEYAAFPLRLIGNLPQMREQYHRRLKYEAALLHIDCSQQFTDIIPPDARKLEELQDIFYTCLAFGLLEENLHTQKYELQYYDELRNVYETTELSYVWNEALEQLANLQDLTRALTALKEKAIDEIRTNSRQWEIYYLPKLRAFVTKTDRLPEDDPNYAERATVVGTRATLDTTAKEGIIVRILRHVQEEVLQKAKVKSDNAVSSKMLSSSSVIEGESTNPRTYNESKFADAELEDTSYLPQAATGELSQSSNSGIQLKGSELLAELNKLALHREQGILTDEEFQVIKKQIIKELS